MSLAPLTRILPPGPDEPASEQIARFNRNPFGYLKTLSEQHGTMFTLQLGSLGNDGVVDIDNNGSWVFLTRPHQVRTMHTADENTVSAALANRIFFGTDEDSVGYIEGQAHRLRRSQLYPSLSSSRDFSPIVAAVVDRCMAQWPRDEPFELFGELQTLTSQIIVEVVCGNLDEADRVTLSTLLPGTENSSAGIDELRAAERAICDFVGERIDGHLAKSGRLGRDDLQATLLRFAADGDASLTDEVVRDEVFSLLYTGFSTTSNTLAWAFKRVLNDKGVYRKLMTELGEDFRAGPLTRASFRNLPYLEATIKETLRLHPVSPLNGVRMVIRPFPLDGYLIPAKTILVQCAYLLQRSPDVYDDPASFTPSASSATRSTPTPGVPSVAAAGPASAGAFPPRR